MIFPPSPNLKSADEHTLISSQNNIYIDMIPLSSSKSHQISAPPPPPPPSPLKSFQWKECAWRNVIFCCSKCDERIAELMQEVQQQNRELESLKQKIKADRKHAEQIVKNLLFLLGHAYRERDVARDELKKAKEQLEKFLATNNLEPFAPIDVSADLPPLPPSAHTTDLQSPDLLMPPPKPDLGAAEASLGVTESDSLAYNNLSESSNLPSDSVFEIAASQDLSCIESYYQPHIPQSCNASQVTGLASPETDILSCEQLVPAGMMNNDTASHNLNLGELVFPGMMKNNIAVNDGVNGLLDSIAQLKPLPEYGKFLQAVVNVGPLLDTLIIAGPVPQWRNPPPSLQAYTAANFNHRMPGPNSSFVTSNAWKSSHTFAWSPQPVILESMANLPGPSASGFSNGQLHADFDSHGNSKTSTSEASKALMKETKK